jgi:hypothetical protein
MNKQIVIDKLKIFLNGHVPFTEEYEVVYFLVEIRKLIEDDKKKFKTLYFYCCWVAHSRLSYGPTVDFLSAKFDDLINLEKKKGEIQHDLMNGQKDFFKLRDLNNQLRTFLKAKELPISFLDGNAWYKFCQLFLDNIAECEIDISEEKKKEHKINKLTVEKINQKYFYEFNLVNSVRIPRIILKFKSK